MSSDATPRAESSATAASPPTAAMPPTLTAGAATGDATAVDPAGVPHRVGDYEIQSEIARGGMGCVFRARQVSLNRPVALKMILGGRLASDTDRQRFRSEAEAAAQLDHPNVVPIYEVGEYDGLPFFSMKLVEGGSLASRERRLAKDAARLVAKIAGAVHYAHQRGILHRDLKPANVLLDRSGEPHVTDFGLAKRVGGCDSGPTATGAVLGTPSYMAPEQAAGQKNISTAVDVYSLGAILYELLTGRPPFYAESVLGVLAAVQYDEVVPPRRLDPDIDRDLETICLKCLEKNPVARYPSAAALAEDLQAWLAGEPITARPATTWERAVKWTRRRPALAALIGVSALSLVGLVVLLALLWLSAEERAETVKSLSQAKLSLMDLQSQAREAQKHAAVQEALADQKRRELAELSKRADEQAHNAKVAAAKADSVIYAADMQFARAAWENDNLERMLTFIENELSSREWFAGPAFSAADIQMSFAIEAASVRGGLDEKRAKTWAWMQKIHARPAYQRALEKGGKYELLR